MRPLSPRVPPYIAPRMPTFASARVATAPLATMPWYRSDARAASAIAVSALMPASTRGSSWATSATTNRQPSSATAAGRTWNGTESAPPPGDPRGCSGGTRGGRNRPPRSGAGGGTPVGGGGERPPAGGRPPAGDHPARQEVGPEPPVTGPGVQPRPAVRRQQPRQLLVLQQR